MSSYEKLTTEEKQRLDKLYKDYNMAKKTKKKAVKKPVKKTGMPKGY